MFDASPARPAHSLLQDRAFATAVMLCGQTPVILPSGLTLFRRRIAGVPLLMLPRADPPPDLPTQLAQASLQRQPLILSPERPCALPRVIPIAAARKAFHVNLSPPQATRRAALHQNWRHQLGQAEASQLRVLHRPLSPDHPLLALEAKQARSHRYQSWPTALTAAFAQTAPDQTHLFTALLRGHPVAYMLFLTHGSAATYHIGHSTTMGRTTRAHNLLLWQAMNALSDRGIRSLDLGVETTPEIDRFKRRAGASVHTTGGTWLRWTPLAQSRCA